MTSLALALTILAQPGESVPESQRQSAYCQGLSLASVTNTMHHGSCEEQAAKGVALFHDVLASTVSVSEVAATELGLNSYAGFYAERQTSSAKSSESDTSPLYQLKTFNAGATHAYASFHDVAPGTVTRHHRSPQFRTGALPRASRQSYSPPLATGVRAD
jgi:hypothetical protein